MLYAVSVAETAMELPSRVALRFGNIEVYWYGLFLAAAILLAIILTGVEAKRKALPVDTAVDVCLVAIPCGVVASRLLYVLMNPASFSGDVRGVFRLWDGRLSIGGAVIGALLGLFFYAKAKKLPFLRLLDTIVPGLSLAQGVALFGDFFNQTGYGSLVTRKSAMWFPLAVRIEETGTIHYAVFFYEFLWCALLFVLLFFVCRKRAKRDGQTLFLYLLLYCIGHIVFEALRVDGAYLFGSVKTSQLVCCVLLLFAAAALLVVKKQQRIDEAAAADIPEDSIVGSPVANGDLPPQEDVITGTPSDDTTEPPEALGRDASGSEESANPEPDAQDPSNGKR